MATNNNYYWYNGKKIQIKESKEKEVIYLSKNSITNNNNLFDKAPTNVRDNANFIGENVYIVKKSIKKEVNSFNKKSSITIGKKVKLYEDEHSSMYATDEFVVQFKKGTTYEEIEIINKKYDAIIVEKYDWNDKYFLLSILNKSQDSIKTANSYCNESKVEFSHPNFILIEQLPSIPNDSLFSQQWGILNEAQTGGISGNDINVVQAWEITIGSPTITIAVIDDGIDYDHEDLNINNKLVLGYNALTKTDDNNLGILDTHGTCCAGVAAAAGNNSMGIIGVAPGCRLIGIKVLTKISETKAILDPNKITDGINIAVKRGADVLSNSWFTSKPFDNIRQALLNAKQNGRRGKGCIICCAAGNNSGQVVFPAKLPEVLAVSACNEFGEFKTTSSRDNEFFWGSCSGPEVAVCAPGVHIATTTKMFDAPDPTLKNYILDFNGTSAATPFVSGVAALILSLNPALNANEVENILKSTSNNLGEQVPNDRIGFGRVNALESVKMAKLTM